MYNNLEIENGQDQRCKFYVVKSLLETGWVDGWMGGWVDGNWKSGFKDCLQQSKKALNAIKIIKQHFNKNELFIQLNNERCLSNIKMSA